jgi:TM2 domain-containing membrane protein YozV
MYCKKCGNQLSDDAKFCPKCGNQGQEILSTVQGTQDQQRSNQGQETSSIAQGTRDQQRSDLIYPKNPPPSKAISWWALLLPGISQIIIGQVAKGILLMGVYLFISFFALNYFDPLLKLCFYIGFFCIAFFDSRKAINTLHSGKAISKWENVPQN